MREVAVGRCVMKGTVYGISFGGGGGSLLHNPKRINPSFQMPFLKGKFKTKELTVSEA
jgi:hypothetical protein